MKAKQSPYQRLKNSTSTHSLIKWNLRNNLKPVDANYLIHLHGVLYVKEYGYDKTFETYVADGLTKFVNSFNLEKDKIWLAEINNQIIGSIAIVGCLRNEAQLRWFLVHPDYRGLGLGKELMKKTLHFCKKRRYKIIFLWSASELCAARHIYMQAGFRKTMEKTHKIWGKRVTEERYDLHLSDNLEDATIPGSN